MPSTKIARTSTTKQGSARDRTGELAELIRRYKGRPGALLGLLEEAQDLERFRYLPEATLRAISEGMAVPLSQVYSVATFYSFFNLKPQGLHTVVVCRGTACHTRGSRRLLDRLKLDLGLHSHAAEDGSEAEKLSITTPDRKYTVRTVACFGQCALAPVVEINHEIFGHMNERALRSEVDELEKESRKHAHPGHQQF